MGLFKPDLYRSFALGCLLGTAAFGLSVSGVAHAENGASAAVSAQR